MKDSVTYQAILEEGKAIGRAKARIEGGQRLLLELGRRRFGPSSSDIEAKIATIGSIEQITDLVERLFFIERYFLRPKRQEQALPAPIH